MPALSIAPPRNCLSRLATRSLSVTRGGRAESLSGVVAELGRSRFEKPPNGGEAVPLALPFRYREELPPADRFGDAVVIDATNLYTDDFEIMDFSDDTSSELIADQLPGVRVVKTFNIIYWETFRDELRPDAALVERYTLFFSATTQA